MISILQPSADAVVTGTAVIAILISLWSLYYARAGVVLAKAQDRRSAPNLLADYLRGDYTLKAGSNERTYHLHLSVRNPSDSDNSVARAELRVTYRLADGIGMTARLPLANLPCGEASAIPLRVGAHESIALRCVFVMSSLISSENRIDGYAIELTDTHGKTIAVMPGILSARVDAI